MSVAAVDLSPAPGVAPARLRVLRHGLVEAGLLARNGEQLLLALVIPAAVVLVGPLLASRFGVSFQQLGGSVLALAVWSSAFTATAIGTGFERRYGVLERLATTPLGRTGLVLGKVLAVIIVITVQVVALTALALAFGWRPVGGVAPTLLLLGCAALAVTTFVALALILAGTLRAEATLALANVIFLLLAGAGGLLVPLADHPAAVAPVVMALPTAAWGEAMRGWTAGTVAWWPVVVLATWALATTLVARKVFRWTS